MKYEIVFTCSYWGGDTAQNQGGDTAHKLLILHKLKQVAGWVAGWLAGWVDGWLSDYSASSGSILQVGTCQILS